MEDGSLKFEYKAGQITGVFINAQLDHIYEKMFNNARRSIRRNPKNIEHGIKVIVFGCFWLEACFNEYIKYFLDNWIHQKKFSRYIWETLKRSNIIQKFEIVSAFATETQLRNYNSNKSKLERVFELRNRLAHFKDNDYQIAETIKDINEVINIMENAPEPKLILELKWPKINEHATAITEGQRWLYAIYNCHSSVKLYKRKDLKPSKKN